MSPDTNAPALIPAPPRATLLKPDLKVVTLYLEDDDDDFLEAITHAARTTWPKVSISRSAVVRLALERLQDTMTPEQIVDEIRPRGGRPGTGIGRKRR